MIFIGQDFQLFKNLISDLGGEAEDKIIVFHIAIHLLPPGQG
jgi:hypothetical membrane protein